MAKKRQPNQPSRPRNKNLNVANILHAGSGVHTDKRRQARVNARATWRKEVERYD